MTLNITVPVFNEECVLEDNIVKLHAFAAAFLPFGWQIVIADNGSTDATPKIAGVLAKNLRNTSALHLQTKGRGAALKAAWERYPADILSYMDADLSTDLEVFPALVSALAGGDGLPDNLPGPYHLAVGSRLLVPGLTTRSFRRELISRAYNLLLKATFHPRFSDAQCGFKAVGHDAARHLLPFVQDTGWFFDTELLILAENWGYRIFELPVRWTESPRSTVNILRTAYDDVKGMIRLRRSLSVNGCLF
jgi:glycosyltransferase involved in cell wall biosynthesis